MSDAQQDGGRRVDGAEMDQAIRIEPARAAPPAGAESGIEETERQLVERARRGDVAAVRTLLSAHREALFALAFGYLRNREEALDAVQDAMAKALLNIRRYDPRRPLSAWLARITRNTCLDRLRRLSHRRHASLEERREAGLADPAATGAGPEALLLQRELRARLYEAIDELRPVEREVIVLRDVLDWPYADIERFLDLGHGTVASLIHRARARLRRRLEPYLACRGRSTETRDDP